MTGPLRALSRISRLHTSSRSLLRSAVREARTARGRSRLPLATNTLFAVAGRGVHALYQWVLLLALTRAFDAQAVGSYSYALAVTAPVYLFTDLQLRSVQASDDGAVFTFGDYAGVRLLGTGLSFLLVGVGGLILSGERASLGLLIIAVSAAKAVDSVADIYHGYFQQRERMDGVAMAKLLRSVAALLAVLVGILLTRRLEIVAMSAATASVLVLVLYERRLVHRDASVRIWSPDHVRALALLALPLGVVSLFMSLATNMPRYLLEAYSGLEDLALYSICSYTVTAGAMVFGGLIQSILPRLGTYYSRGSFFQFRRMLLLACGLALGVGVFGAIVSAVGGHWALDLVFGAEYSHGAPVLAWSALGAGFVYASGILEGGLTAARCIRDQARVAIVVLALAAAFGWLAIPRWGAVGAARAGTAAAFGMMVLRGWTLRQHLLTRHPSTPGKSSPAGS